MSSATMQYPPGLNKLEYRPDFVIRGLHLDTKHVGFFESHTLYQQSSSLMCFNPVLCH